MRGLFALHASPRLLPALPRQISNTFLQSAQLSSVPQRRVRLAFPVRQAPKGSSPKARQQPSVTPRHGGATPTDKPWREEPAAEE